MMKAASLSFMILMMALDQDEAAVFVSVAPERSQFFKYDRFSVSCDGEEEATGWSVMQRMNDGEVKLHETPYSVSAAFPHEHSGVYWCEDELGANSSHVLITVTVGSVILVSPVLPVTEGGNVTLSCRFRPSAHADTSCSPAEFYKDGARIETSSTGNMTVSGVSGSDRGFYKCKVCGSGESPESWLSVRAPADVPSTPSAPVLSVWTLMHHLMVVAPYLLSTIVLGLIYKDRRTDQRDERAGQRRARDKVLVQIIT